MDNQTLYRLIPGLTIDELEYLKSLTSELQSERELETFASIYNGKRRSPDIILVGAILGLFLVAGIQRFMINQIGMGILYLLTGGLCLIGTIVDLVNYRNLAFEYNQTMALESLNLTRSLRN